MDHRRHLTPLALVLATAGLGACAGLPKPLPGPKLAAQTSLVQLAARPVVGPLLPVSLPRVRFATCVPLHHAKSKGAHKVRRCSAVTPVVAAASPRGLPVRAVASSAARVQAGPPMGPNLIHAAYIRPIPAFLPVTAKPPRPQAPPLAAPARPVLPVRAILPTGPVDHREGAIEVFAYTPGRVFTVRAAPLRVTTLQLQAGETLIDKAAGDTVRWQIGETTSGAGESARSLVIIKPLAAGLSTNLVLTTSRRVYLIELASGRTMDMTTAVAWAYAEPVPVLKTPVVQPAEALALSAPLVGADAGAGRYKIAPQGRRPRWTPVSVFDDGRRTFVAFAPGLDRSPSPLLFVRDAGQAPALVNYRQRGDVYVIDRLFDEAELRLGDRRPEVVRLSRLQEAVR